MGTAAIKQFNGQLEQVGGQRMNGAIVRVQDQPQQISFDEMMTLAQTFAASGMFTGTTSAAQCVVKIMAGREMGIGPFAAMQGFHVIQGRPVMSANLIAACIKKHPLYNYRVVRLDDQACIIKFYERGEEIGESSLTMEEAEALRLNQDLKNGQYLYKANWQKYPRNMLFARAMSNGARWYCPDIFGGMPVYTADEMDAQEDEDGNVITVTPTRIAAPRQEEAPAAAAPVSEAASKARKTYNAVLKVADDVGMDLVNVAPDWVADDDLALESRNLAGQIRTFIKQQATQDERFAPPPDDASLGEWRKFALDMFDTWEREAKEKQQQPAAAGEVSF